MTLLLVVFITIGCKNNNSNKVKELSDRVTELEDKVESLTKNMELIVEFQNGVLKYEARQNAWNEAMKENVDIVINILQQKNQRR